MEHHQRFLIPLAAADGSTNSSPPSADLYLSGDFSIPPPPMPSVNATPLFPQDQLMKFLATVGAVDVPSPDLINPTLQTFSDLPLVISGESSNERFSATPFPPPLLPPPLPSSNQKGKAMMTRKLERRRWSTMGDRIRILEGMMPCGRKMDTVTLLAEVHTYVKFLEAQVTALQSIPSASSGSSPWPFYPPDLALEEAIGGLGRLNRQQLLLNSTVMLDLLSKKGCCVMSTEQAMARGPDGTVGKWITGTAEPAATAIDNDELSYGTGLIELIHSTRLVMKEGVLCDVDILGGGALAGDDMMPEADASSRA